MFDQKVSPLFQIILISVYFQIISGFFERVDEIPKVNELKNVRNKSEEVLDGLEWKRVDREFVKFGIRSDLKNIVAKRMIIKNEFFEKMEIKESKDSFDNRRSDRTARNGRMNLALDVDQSLQFNQQLNTTSDKKPKVLVQILQRIRRKAEKKSNREDKRKKENKDQSITDSIMEMASETFKQGLRKGVQLWNKLKTSITDSFNSLTNEK